MADDAAEDEAPVDGAAAGQRKSFFQAPNVREDVRALPQIFRSRRLMWLPLLLILIGFVLTLTIGALPEGVAGIASLYVQYFFLPPPIFTFFITGYVAPRASYLVGGIYGFIAGVLWTVALGALGTQPVTNGAEAPADPVAGAIAAILYGTLFGSLLAAFAAWYRDFLRNMRVRGDQRRAEKELEARAKRRQERQEARRGTR